MNSSSVPTCEKKPNFHLAFAITFDADLIENSYNGEEKKPSSPGFGGDDQPTFPSMD